MQIITIPGEGIKNFEVFDAKKNNQEKSPSIRSGQKEKENDPSQDEGKA